MLANLVIGLPTITLCLLLQGVLSAVAIRFYVGWHGRRAGSGFWSNLHVINGVLIILIFGNFAQVTIWGLLFRLLGEFDQITEAIYHSAVNFATLGYGDIVMSERYRLLGPLEAINGAIMIGVSTASLTSAFQDLLRRSSRSKRG